MAKAFKSIEGFPDIIQEENSAKIFIEEERVLITSPVENIKGLYSIAGSIYISFETENSSYFLKVVSREKLCKAL